MLQALRDRLAQDEDGFTLIELLVVVIIIGILAAIAIPVFLNQRESGWLAAVESDARNVAIDIETAATQNNGTYPAAVPAGVIYSQDVAELAYATTGQDFCLQLEHAQLTTAGWPAPQAVYDSDAGGVIVGTDAAAAACA